MMRIEGRSVPYRSPSEFGRRLESLRVAAGYSRAELASMVGAPEKSVYRWENGAEPKWSALVRLADALGVPLDAFRGPKDGG